MLQIPSIRLPFSKKTCLATIALLLLYLLLNNVRPAIQYNVFPHPHPILLDDAGHDANGSDSLTTVNLVIASVAGDDVAWTSNLPIPNLNVLRYVSNDRLARFHPPVSKGREALMYFTYLHDFYDNLPDITIFVHAEETPWHVEGTLLQNTTFVLSQLDLHQVQVREYFNLRVTWRAGCPAWIDTRKTFDNWDIQEEPYMREAWQANFGDDFIPDTLGGPCCSQFAVSREAIHRRPKEQYKQSMDWLIQTKWSDSIVGRVWEHLWPWLFTNNASDCAHLERQSLCQMYAICFIEHRELDDYKELWEERERLKEDMSFFRAVWNAKKAAAAKRKFGLVNDEIQRQLSVAWRRGKDLDSRAELMAASQP